MGKYDKVNKCPEEFIGRIIDIMEDYISKKNQDSSDDTPNTVHIQGDDYTYLSDALKDTLEKWILLHIELMLSLFLKEKPFLLLKVRMRVF